MNKIKTGILVVCFIIVFLLIIPISLMYYFMGEDAWRIIKVISIIIGLAIIMIPVYIFAGLARSGAPIPIADFVTQLIKVLKEGISGYLRKPKK